MNKRKTVLITGATSGVGYAVAQRLLNEKEQFEVFVTGRSIEKLTILTKLGAVAIEADLTNPADIDRLVSNCPSPHIVLFCAGVGLFQAAHLLPDVASRDMMETNVLAPIALTKRVLPAMMERRSGHLIYVGSQAGKVATPKASVYAASKHALLGYTNALRMEVAEFNIQVSVVNPGPIDTPFIDRADTTGTYRSSLGKHLLAIDEVADCIQETISTPKRDVNLPGIMGFTSKLYGLAPSLVEKLGRKYFMKK